MKIEKMGINCSQSPPNEDCSALSTEESAQEQSDQINNPKEQIRNDSEQENEEAFQLIIDLTKKIDEKDHIINEKDRKINELYTNLAAEMSTKVSTDESSVENVSVKNRPMNVAQEYQLLCSNQWLDAKSELDEFDVAEEDKLLLLCQIIKVSYEEAQAARSDMKKLLVELLTKHGEILEEEKYNKSGEPENMKVNKQQMGKVTSEQVQTGVLINTNGTDQMTMEKDVSKIMQENEAIVSTGKTDTLTTEGTPSLPLAGYKDREDQKYTEQNGSKAISEEQNDTVDTEETATTVIDIAVDDIGMQDQAYKIPDTLKTEPQKEISEDTVINIDGSDKQDEQNVEQSMLQTGATEPHQKTNNKEYQVLLPMEIQNAIGDFLRSHSDTCSLDKQSKAVLMNIDKASENLSAASYLKLWIKAKHSSALQTYISDMVRVTWKMVLQRPPMAFQHSNKWLGESFQELCWNSEKSATSIGIEVYPMLYHADSLMAKGKILLVEKNKAI